MRERSGIIQAQETQNQMGTAGSACLMRSPCRQPELKAAQKDHGHPAYVCYSKDTNRMRADVNRNMVRSMKWASGPPGLIPEDYKCGAAC